MTATTQRPTDAELVALLRQVTPFLPLWLQDKTRPAADALASVDEEQGIHPQKVADLARIMWARTSDSEIYDERYWEGETRVALRAVGLIGEGR